MKARGDVQESGTDKAGASSTFTGSQAGSRESVMADTCEQAQVGLRKTTNIKVCTAAFHRPVKHRADIQANMQVQQDGPTRLRRLQSSRLTPKLQAEPFALSSPGASALPAFVAVCLRCCCCCCCCAILPPPPPPHTARTPPPHSLGC